ncbi:MAG: DoxX family protein [Fimbriimonadaceae bacterium]
MKENRLLDTALLILRLGIGVVFFIYGAQKAFGVWGGNGWVATVEGFEQGMGIPPFFGALAILAELLGGLGVLVGLLTRVAAFGLLSTMAVATYTKIDAIVRGEFVVTEEGVAATVQHVMWPGAWLLISAALLLVGAGRFSLDSVVFKKKGRR